MPISTSIQSIYEFLISNCLKPQKFDGFHAINFITHRKISKNHQSSQFQSILVSKRYRIFKDESSVSSLALFG